MPLTSKNVFSSHISSVGYNDEEESLHIEFRNGRKAVYSNVPSKIGKTVLDAPSVGTALHALVRNKYQFEYQKPTTPAPMPKPPSPNNALKKG